MKLHKKIARLLDYELIKRKKHPSSGTHLINLINRYSIDLVIDVGANQGQFGTMLREQGYKGEIHSFEPVASTFSHLTKAASTDEAWNCHQLALGDTPGERFINVSQSSDLSSFLNANEFGTEKYKKIAAVSQEAVKVNTLDNFFRVNKFELGLRKVLLKLDTQGYDLQVVKGAAQSLPHMLVLLSELSFIPIYDGMPNYLEALNTYRDLGFSVTGFYPISRKDDFSVVEMDCMFINDRLINRV